MSDFVYNLLINSTLEIGAFKTNGFGVILAFLLLAVIALKVGPRFLKNFLRDQSGRK